MATCSPEGNFPPLQEVLWQYSRKKSYLWTTTVWTVPWNAYWEEMPTEFGSKYAQEHNSHHISTREAESVVWVQFLEEQTNACNSCTFSWGVILNR